MEGDAQRVHSASNSRRGSASEDARGELGTGRADLLVGRNSASVEVRDDAGRARLVGTGSDVWEVVTAVKDNDGDVAATAKHLQPALGLVQSAVAYYGAFAAEIDAWIERHEQAATEARSAWLAGQAALWR